MEREYRKYSSVNPCKFTKEDIIKVISYIKDSFVNDNYTIRIESNYEHIQFKADEIVDFFKLKELPGILNNIDILAIGKAKSIYLQLANYHNSLSVNGSDESWVLGTFQKIEKYISKKRPWFYNMYVGSLIAFIINAILIILLFDQVKESKYFMILLLPLIIISLYVFSTGRIREIFPDFKLLIVKPDTIITRDNFILLIYVLTFFATILSVIIPLLRSKP